MMARKQRSTAPKLLSRLKPAPELTTIQRLDDHQMANFHENVVQLVCATTGYSAGVVIDALAVFFDAKEDDGTTYYFTEGEALEWGLRAIKAAYSANAQPHVVARGVLYQIKQGRHQKAPAPQHSELSIYGHRRQERGPGPGAGANVADRDAVGDDDAAGADGPAMG